jgi:hypothetical protein
VSDVVGKLVGRASPNIQFLFAVVAATFRGLLFTLDSGFLVPGRVQLASARPPHIDYDD